MELNKKSEERKLDPQELNDMASLFDLLARFDHEDKQKEKSVLKTGSSVPSSRESVLFS